MGLGAMALAVLVIANDFTALSVALPAIEQGFDTDVTTVQWIITGYALVFGVLIVTGGRLADMFGRRHVFFVGTTIFAVFSVLGGFAIDAWMLLAARGAMGVGGALMWPAILGMTYALTPAGRAALALDLLPDPADRGDRRRGRLARRPAGCRRRQGPADRLCRRDHALDWPARPAAGARPGGRSRLDQRADPRPVCRGGSEPAAVRPHRASGGRERP